MAAIQGELALRPYPYHLECLYHTNFGMVRENVLEIPPVGRIPTSEFISYQCLSGSPRIKFDQGLHTFLQRCETNHLNKQRCCAAQI